MKNIFTFLFGMLISMMIYAQPCTPDPAYTQTGVYPDSLPKAKVNVPYNAFLTAVIPADTTVSGVTATVDSVKITNITGLPTGITYATNPANGVIQGGSKGCIAFTGTVVDTALKGTYPLTISATAYGKIYGTMPVEIPYDFTDYKLIVEAGTGIKDFSKSAFEVNSIFPNPASNLANISLYSNEASFVSVNIKDITGRIVFSNDYDINSGDNLLKLNISSLPEGIYFCSIVKDRSIVTRKLVINR